jgi:hypothetical protein
MRLPRTASELDLIWTVLSHAAPRPRITIYPRRIPGLFPQLEAKPSSLGAAHASITGTYLNTDGEPTPGSARGPVVHLSGLHMARELS